jgi:hypothetical protein
MAGINGAEIAILAILFAWAIVVLYRHLYKQVMHGESSEKCEDCGIAKLQRKKVKGSD